MPPGEPRFGELGEAYDTYRVGYTPMVYDYLARVCGLREGIDVVDLGCGTGLSTRPLIERARTSSRSTRTPRCWPSQRATWTATRGSCTVAPRRCRCPTRRPTWWSPRRPRTGSTSRTPTTRSAACCGPDGAVALLWKYPAPETPYTYLVDELMSLITNEPIRTVYGVGTVPELLRPCWQDYRRVVFDQPVAYTVESYVGFISSRDRVRQIAGARRDALLEALTERLAAWSRPAPSSSATSPTS